MSILIMFSRTDQSHEAIAYQLFRSTINGSHALTSDRRCVGASFCVGTVKLSSLSKPVLGLVVLLVSVPVAALEVELTVIGA